MPRACRRRRPRACSRRSMNRARFGRLGQRIVEGELGQRRPRAPSSGVTSWIGDDEPADSRDRRSRLTTSSSTGSQLPSAHPDLDNRGGRARRARPLATARIAAASPGGTERAEGLRFETADRVAEQRRGRRAGEADARRRAPSTIVGEAPSWTRDRVGAAERRIAPRLARDGIRPRPTIRIAAPAVPPGRRTRRVAAPTGVREHDDEEHGERKQAAADRERAQRARACDAKRPDRSVRAVAGTWRRPLGGLFGRSSARRPCASPSEWFTRSYLIVPGALPQTGQIVPHRSATRPQPSSNGFGDVRTIVAGPRSGDGAAYAVSSSPDPESEGRPMIHPSDPETRRPVAVRDGHGAPGHLFGLWLSPPLRHRRQRHRLVPLQPAGRPGRPRLPGRCVDAPHDVAGIAPPRWRSPNGCRGTTPSATNAVLLVARLDPVAHAAHGENRGPPAPSTFARRRARCGLSQRRSGSVSAGQPARARR